jgi:hypothetical protein
MEMMNIEIDVDELVGLMLENKLFEEAMCELHPEFMVALGKRLQFLKDIVKAGRLHEWQTFEEFSEVWTQEELEEDRAMQLDASMRRSVNNLIYTRSIK